MPWLLDTNILSELRRLKPEPKVLTFLARHALDDLYLSTVTLVELRFGIELLSDDGHRRDELNKWLMDYIRPMFEQRVLPITEEVMFRWRILVEQGRKAGHTYSQPDFIAATALDHGLTVVTRDKSDFDKAGVPVLNPREAISSDIS
jgi:predicted nucleic acid-binding protein